MDNKIRFTPYEIKDCLFDHKRTLNLEHAINEQVKPGDVVLEAGGGTGILSMFALKAGAKHAYIIELTSRFTQVIREIAELNGFSDKITVINGDATETDIPEAVDVYISELLCTGLFNEPQIQAYNNCRRFFKEDTVCIPNSVESSIHFAGANEYVYGIQISIDSYLAQDVPHTVKTTKQKYMDIIFDGDHVNPYIHDQNWVKPLDGAEGQINSAIIESSAMLSPNIKAEQTNFLFNPELIFFKNRHTIGCELGSTDCVRDDYVIREGTNLIDYEIEYMAGGDTRDIKMRVF